MTDDLPARLKQAAAGSRELSDEQIAMMKHALGYGRRRHGRRNHYAIEPGCTGWDAWQDLIARGLAEDRGQYPGGLHCLVVTQAGRGALRRAKQAEADASNRRHMLEG